MKKVVSILSLITLSLINFASAGFIEDSFDIIGIDNIFLVLIFLISFTLINYSLNRIFRKNSGAAGIVAFLISIGITAGVSIYEIDLSGFIFDLGIADGILFPIIFIIITIGLIWLIWTKGLGFLFMSIGALLFALSWISYEDSLIRWASAFFFIIGAFLWWKKRKKKRMKESGAYHTKGFWTKNRNLPNMGVGKGIKWGAKKGWGRAKATGKWAERKIKSETIAKDREMSKRRAEKTAYEENAKREEEKKKVTLRIQKQYDELKNQYSKAKKAKDTIAIKNIDATIRSITNQARKYRINLRY